MDTELVLAVIDRDWQVFIAQAARLGLGAPRRTGVEIGIPVRPAGTGEDYLAILECDGYDVAAPLLDFANPEHPDQRGGPCWPRMGSAPMNQITIGNRSVPIICTPGTRGYHLHISHVHEAHPRTTWRLSAVATLLHRFLTQMGPYQGRGV